MQVIAENGELLREYEFSVIRRVVRKAHRGLSLDVVAFSDWRVQDISNLIRFLQTHRRPDLILYAGDDVERFRTSGKNYFDKLAKVARYGLCAVAGNDEHPEHRELIKGRGVYAVHSSPLILVNFAIVGLEGAPLFRENTRRNIGYLLYPPAIRAAIISSWAVRLRGKRLIVVSHAPPFGVLDFAVRFSRDHIGCQALREFLESSNDAILCVCGHVHRHGGQVANVGQAVVVNAASHDRPGEPGKVAMITITKGRVLADRVQWRLLT
jgi:Icc-related predicted phosphoesterase